MVRDCFLSEREVEMLRDRSGERSCKKLKWSHKQKVGEMVRDRIVVSRKGQKKGLLPKDDIDIKLFTLLK